MKPGDIVTQKQLSQILHYWTPPPEQTDARWTEKGLILKISNCGRGVKVFWFKYKEIAKHYDRFMLVSFRENVQL